MNRYFIRLSYCGTAYNGWQSQPHAQTKTIQRTIEHVLTTLIRKEVAIVGCGRTDTGVHAKNYVAHVDIPNGIDIKNLVYRANKLLPGDIAIHEIIPVTGQAHARFDAISRSYEYHLHTAKSPFEPFSYYYYYDEPDLEKLNAAASLLPKYTDFTTFCKLHSDVHTMNCKLTESIWIKNGDTYIYKVTSDRFLRGMIRLVAGMCLQVSRGKLTLDDVRYAMDKRCRLPQDWSVPAIGLVLCDIRYNMDTLASLSKKPLQK